MKRERERETESLVHCGIMCICCYIHYVYGKQPTLRTLCVYETTYAMYTLCNNVHYVYMKQPILRIGYAITYTYRACTLGNTRLYT